MNPCLPFHFSISAGVGVLITGTLPSKSSVTGEGESNAWKRSGVYGVLMWMLHNLYVSKVPQNVTHLITSFVMSSCETMSFEILMTEDPVSHNKATGKPFTRPFSSFSDPCLLCAKDAKGSLCPHCRYVTFPASYRLLHSVHSSGVIVCLSLPHCSRLNTLSHIHFLYSCRIDISVYCY